MNKFIYFKRIVFCDMYQLKIYSFVKSNLLTRKRDFCKTTLNNQEVYFGYEKVNLEEKNKKVQAVFTSVAENYDLMNDIMSGGIHRLWKDYFVSLLCPMPGIKLLDAAGGTGDIALRFLHAVNIDSPRNDYEINTLFNEDGTVSEKSDKTHAVVLDFNKEMVSICKQRAKESGLLKDLTCIQGDAESVPFEDNTFDVYTIAFGIRNVANIEKALSEAFRVLKPGGRFLCMEFSHVKNPFISRLYDLYSFQVLPVMGQLVAGDWRSYQYLAESIRKFPDQNEFQNMIEEASFSVVSYENLCDGIAAIHSAYKM